MFADDLLCFGKPDASGKKQVLSHTFVAPARLCLRDFVADAQEGGRISNDLGCARPGAQHSLVRQPDGRISRRIASGDEDAGVDKSVHQTPRRAVLWSNFFLYRLDQRGPPAFRSGVNKRAKQVREGALRVEIERSVAPAAGSGKRLLGSLTDGSLEAA
jgi:hypothetical protein